MAENFDITAIAENYQAKKGYREAMKWAFSLSTLGIGGLYLWLTTEVIEQGQIGLRRNARGEMTLLPAGRHSNFPWESYAAAPRSLAQKVIQLGPYKIITVETGYVAKTSNHGNLEILAPGHYLISDAAHRFSEFIPVKQETKKLHEVKAITKDNVGLTLHADVRYKIKDPLKAVTKIDDIETSITEIAEINIGQIVGHHNLADFAPATANASTGSAASSSSSSSSSATTHDLSEVITELTDTIKARLIKLGIKLLSIGITSWSINDKELAHELGQGAVIQSQTASKKLAANRDAEIKIIAAEADAKAVEVRAKGDAAAIKINGEAIRELAQQFKDDPIAAEIYARTQQVELVSRAKNSNLFFTQPSTSTQSTLPLINLNLPAASEQTAGIRI